MIGEEYASGGCSSVLGISLKNLEILAYFQFFPIFPPVPLLNLVIPPQQKLLFRNEKDMGYHFGEFCFFSFKPSFWTHLKIGCILVK